MIFQVQFPVPGGQAGATGGFQLAEKVPGGALAGLRQAGEMLHFTQVFEHFTGRAAAAIAIAKGHKDLFLDFLLLEAFPGSQGRFRRGRGIIGAGVGGAVLWGGAEVGQNTRAIQSLPPERVVGEAVVLVPTEFDREKIIQPGLFDQLRQRPGITENIRQPEDRRFDRGAKMLAETTAPEQELARERLSAAQVAIGLDPHPANRLPAAFSDARLDSSK